jgi:outer membrane immunogenic protein
MKKFGLALLAVVGCTPVLAADLPPPQPMVYKAPPPMIVPVATWQGFYVGGNVGYGWDPASATFNPSTYATTILGPLGGPFVDTGPDSGPIALSVAPKGWLGGAQFGYNWQRQSLVLGAEADIMGANIKGSTSAPFFVNGTEGGDDAGFSGNVGLQQKLDYFGTLRGRLGWANDTLLLYGTGGLAWGHVTTTFNTFGITQTALGGFTPAQLAALQSGGFASASDIRWGYAVGAGFEWMIARNWSVRGEYLYVNLGGGDTLVIPGGVANSNLSVNVARVGFNYFLRP